jgi:glycosyltransferase, family 1
MLMVMKSLCKKQLNIVHIAHNTFSSLRLFSLFPRYIISVSNGVKENLIKYFRVPKEYIHKIHNGLPDSAILSQGEGEGTSILFAGRLTQVKQQIEFVKRTKGKLGPGIRIDFAGSGEDEIKLMEEIKGDIHYRYIGQIDIHNYLPKYDYVCLFSRKEGLGLSLVEGCMYGKPLITNDILPVLDVNTNGYNGFVFPTWEALINGLNHLPKRDTPEYQSLSRNARLRYEERFTENAMIKSYREYLEEIMLNKQ